MDQLEFCKHIIPAVYAANFKPQLGCKLPTSKLRQVTGSFELHKHDNLMCSKPYF